MPKIIAKSSVEKKCVIFDTLARRFDAMFWIESLSVVPID